ncbi:Protein TIFY 11e [Zea mays]|jgi:jasmonate ZIM domain-containing protein|uniref:Protein TIFY n=2 Tax=Zea mays TaxID=4577 RepID=B6U6B4_MAIZE|eukprot:NP_001151346.2 ZIM motif family protein [Zea mays]
MAAAGSVQGHGARFAAACGVLSRYVKAAAVATTTTVELRPAGTVGVLPLMPGADLSTQEEREAGAGPGPSPSPSAQLTISYGGRVVVLDDVPADKAAEVVRLAAAQGAPRALRAPPTKADDLPMARKVSLQQFMERRKGRVATRGSPYRRPASLPDHLTLTL